MHEDASPIAIGDWGDALGHDFAGDAQYRVEFELGGSDAVRGSTLDLGEVWGVAEVVLNRRASGHSEHGSRSGSIFVGRGAGRHQHAAGDRDQHHGQPIPEHQEPRSLAGQRPRDLSQAVRILEKGCVQSGLHGSVTINL